MKYYRYRALNQFAEDIITKRELYFASPKQFNDPFEFEFYLTFDCSLKVKREFLEASPEFDFKNEFKKLDQETLNKFLERSLSPADAEKARQEFRNKYLEFGLLCLAKSPCNIGMWAHYGDNHKGICFEFDFKGNDFGSCLKVDYQVEAPTFNYFDHLDNPRETFTKKIVTTKSKYWEHEQEYRFILNQPAIATFKPDDLTGAYLGMDIDRNHPIFKLMAKHTPNLSLYFLNPSKAKYGFEVSIPILAKDFI